MERSGSGYIRSGDGSNLQRYRQALEAAILSGGREKGWRLWEGLEAAAKPGGSGREVASPENTAESPNHVFPRG